MKPNRRISITVLAIGTCLILSAPLMAAALSADFSAPAVGHQIAQANPDGTFGPQLTPEEEQAMKDKGIKDDAKEVVEPFKKRKLNNPLATYTINSTIGGVIRIFTGIAGSLALLMFVYGSLLLMTSRGEPGRVNKGKRAMLMAAVGLAIIFGAYAALQAIFNGIGI